MGASEALPFIQQWSKNTYQDLINILLVRSRFQYLQEPTKADVLARGNPHNTMEAEARGERVQFGWAKSVHAWPADRERRQTGRWRWRCGGENLLQSYGSPAPAPPSSRMTDSRLWDWKFPCVSAAYMMALGLARRLWAVWFEYEMKRLHNFRATSISFQIRLSHLQNYHRPSETLLIHIWISASY